jgi:hypothetical protein
VLPTLLIYHTQYISTSYVVGFTEKILLSPEKVGAEAP